MFIFRLLAQRCAQGGDIGFFEKLAAAVWVVVGVPFDHFLKGTPGDAKELGRFVHGEGFL
jgi:hypothetical protein